MKEQKTVAESATTLSQVMMPRDANHYGNVHGGVIMKLVDDVAYVVASRHARRNVVTASIDSLSFKNPVHIGDVVILKAHLTYVGRTSMEVEVKVDTERLKTGETLPVATAYITMVALDDKGRPTPVPGLLIKTEEEKKRYKEAQIRRKERLKKVGRGEQ